MVSSDDAWMFPIGGSVMLVGLYVLFKYLNKDYLNYLFTAYFGLIGIFAVSNVPPPCQPPIPCHASAGGFVVRTLMVDWSVGI